MNLIVQLIEFVHGDGNSEIYESHKNITNNLTKSLLNILKNVEKEKLVDLMLSLARINFHPLLVLG